MESIDGVARRSVLVRARAKARALRSHRRSECRPQPRRRPPAHRRRHAAGARRVHPQERRRRAHNRTRVDDRSRSRSSARGAWLRQRLDAAAGEWRRREGSDRARQRASRRADGGRRRRVREGDSAARESHGQRAEREAGPAAAGRVAGASKTVRARPPAVEEGDRPRPRGHVRALRARRRAVRDRRSENCGGPFRDRRVANAEVG